MKAVIVLLSMPLWIYASGKTDTPVHTYREEPVRLKSCDRSPSCGELCCGCAVLCWMTVGEFISYLDRKWSKKRD